MALPHVSTDLRRIGGDRRPHAHRARARLLPRAKNLCPVAHGGATQRRGRMRSRRRLTQRRGRTRSRRRLTVRLAVWRSRRHF